MKMDRKKKKDQAHFLDDIEGFGHGALLHVCIN
jgi:hypothetical protein